MFIYIPLSPLILTKIYIKELNNLIKELNNLLKEFNNLIKELNNLIKELNRVYNIYIYTL